jgi:hypothetical protein
VGRNLAARPGQVYAAIAAWTRMTQPAGVDAVRPIP